MLHLWIFVFKRSYCWSPAFCLVGPKTGYSGARALCPLNIWHLTVERQGVELSVVRSGVYSWLEQDNFYQKWSKTLLSSLGAAYPSSWSSVLPELHPTGMQQSGHVREVLPFHFTAWTTSTQRSMCHKNNLKRKKEQTHGQMDLRYPTFTNFKSNIL